MLLIEIQNVNNNSLNNEPEPYADQLTGYNISIAIFCSVLIFFGNIPRSRLSFKETLQKNNLC